MRNFQALFTMVILEVHKHEIILSFFLPESNPFMPFTNFRKISLLFLRLLPNFDVRTFPRWLGICGTKFFWELSKIFYQSLHFGPIRWVPRRFFKILIFYRRNLHFNEGFLSNIWELLHAHAGHARKRFCRVLGMRGTNFIACWACEERISARAQPAVKC